MLISVNHACIGKDKNTVGAAVWQRLDIDIPGLVDLQYIQGMAIAPGLFKGHQKVNEAWQGSELVIVDIDDYAGDTLADALATDYVANHCIAAYPSSSYGQLKKYHFLFALSERVTDLNAYTTLAAYIAAQFPMPTDKAMVKASQACFGTVFSGDMGQHKKSLTDGLCYISQNAQPVRAIDTLRAIIREQNQTGQGSIQLTDAQISARAERHHEQDEIMRERITLDALSFALKGWGRRDYNEWLSLCFGAYDGCNSQAVMQAILDHPDIDWSGDEKRNFISWWAQAKEGGVTVASLFYMARKNGWLQSTSVDLQTGDYEEINTPDLREWLLERPVDPRALYVSATGSSKTLGAIATLKRLGIPKSVFFAPSIKLCYDLSAKLLAHGVYNVLYIDDGNTKSSETLQNANVLVTTLQTFGVKVMSKAAGLEDYVYIVLDESDETISAFARSDTGHALGYPSHVNREQAQWGMHALERIIQTVPYVHMFDATATRLSLTLLQMYCPADKPPVCYRNNYLRSKAEVTFLQSAYDARRVAVEAAINGNTLVVATDTRKEANLIALYLVASGAATAEETIVITGDTHYDHRVSEFLHDVERGAKQYRVIIYNSAMGSGVSITETKPDIFVQTATYISPRKNLQILNRFRQQSLVFAYVPGTENLYGEPIQDKMLRLQSNLRNEEALSGVAYIPRHDIADNVTRLAGISYQDENEQKRAVREMYTGLLQRDGRNVALYNSAIATDEFRERFALAYDLLKTKKAEILAGWRAVAPIDNKRPPEFDATAEDVAKGILHARIERMVDDIDSIKADDSTIASIVLSYGRYIYNVERWLKADKAATNTLSELTDDKRADVTLRLYLGRLELIGLIGLLIPDAHARIEPGKLQEQAAQFVREIKLREQVFNSLSHRQRNYIKNINKDKTDIIEQAIAYAKIILKTLGLSLNKRNGQRKEGKRERVYQCEGVDDIIQFLSWRGTTVDTIHFGLEGFRETIGLNAEAVRQYTDMRKQEQDAVRRTMHELDRSLVDAVSVLEQSPF